MSTSGSESTREPEPLSDPVSRAGSGGPGGLLGIVGPGLLVAATGVGAGDLATSAFTGSRVGLSVLWAVILGAVLKFVLTEGLARWQLATGRTYLEGLADRFGRRVLGVFLVYLIFWSFFVGSALMSACGVTLHAIAPLGDAASDKLVYGILHSVLAVVFVLRGGFEWFERVMGLCVGLMSITVLATAVAIAPPWGEVARGLVVPRLPVGSDALGWTVALIGGVGGTVTILGYGYWIRSSGREGLESLRTCRIDLGVGYVFTALFGVAMVIIGTATPVEGRGAGLVVALGEELRDRLGSAGPAMRMVFLGGAWCAVASSLLGVWQSVPYLFTDVWQRMGWAGADPDASIHPGRREFRVYLVALATLPALGLAMPFDRVQKLYAIVGAFFMPLLALSLMILGRSRGPLAGKAANPWWSTVGLTTALLFFLVVGAKKLGLPTSAAITPDSRSLDSTSAPGRR